MILFENDSLSMSHSILPRNMSDFKFPKLVCHKRLNFEAFQNGGFSLVALISCDYFTARLKSRELLNYEALNYIKPEHTTKNIKIRVVT